MNGRYISKWCMVATLAVYGTGFGSPKAIAQQGQADVEEGVEVLTRGPVHEAFAVTVTFDPEPGIVVSQSPPEAIEEVPPEQRPEGDNVAWIPGYFAWDDERSDFLWISGIWRNLPPGRQWVPGYWGEAGQDYQWTSGYWADSTVSDVEYLPEPPATVEAGPNIAAPSENHIWTPGCWVWNQSRYAWRPGYWETAQPDWTWIPAHYVWSPRGYVFVDGYYDYSVDRRGVLFAPVYFNASVYSRQGFNYSPATVINPAVFASQLFLRPRYQHYYFGDYYADDYSRAGYHPWYSYNSSRFGYDPIYAHERWQHRQDREWEQNVRADFENRRDHEDARPPRTWAAQRTLIAREANSDQKSFVVAASLDQLANSKESRLRFQPVGREERQRLAEHGQEIQQFRQGRQKLETRADKSIKDPAQRAEPARVKLSRSPIFAKAGGELGKDHAPPQTHKAPQPDLKVEAKARPRDEHQGRVPTPSRNDATTNRQPKSPEDQPLRSPKLDRQPSLTGEPGRSSKFDPKPSKEDRPDSNRLEQPTPRVNRSSDQPRPHTTNRRSLDTEDVPQRGSLPATRDDSSGPPRGSHIDQPKSDRTLDAQGDRRSNQPPRQPKADRQSPAQRVDRDARQPQSQPRVDRQRPEPKVNRSSQPQPQPKVDRSSQRQPQSTVNRPTPQPQGNPAARQRGSADSPSANPQSDEQNRKGKE